MRYVTRKPAASTFMRVVMVGPAGEKSLVRVASDAYLPEPADITPMALEGVGHVHLTLGSPGLAAAAMSAAASRGLAVSLDLEAADMPADPTVARARGTTLSSAWLVVLARLICCCE